MSSKLNDLYVIKENLEKKNSIFIYEYHSMNISGISYHIHFFKIIMGTLFVD